MASIYLRHTAFPGLYFTYTWRGHMSLRRDKYNRARTHIAFLFFFRTSIARDILKNSIYFYSRRVTIY